MHADWRTIPEAMMGQARLALRGVDLFCKGCLRDARFEGEGLPCFPHRLAMTGRQKNELSFFLQSLPGIPDAARALASDPRSPLAQAARMLKTGRNEEALALLRHRVTERAANHHEWMADMALRLRAEAGLRTGLWAQAEADMALLQARYPDLVFLGIDRAWLLVRDGRDEEAGRLLAGLELQDEDRWAALTAGELACGLLGRGRLRLARGAAAAAEADFALAAHHAGSRRPSLLASALAERGRAAVIAGQPLAALGHLERAVAECPHPIPAEYLYIRARLRWINGNATGAVQDLDAALSLNPGAGTWNRLLELYRREGGAAFPRTETTYSGPGNEQRPHSLSLAVPELRTGAF